jgi:Uma2 family endonuclease
MTAMLASPESLPRLPPDEYLAYEQQQQLRHELVDGYLYAMTGASDRHEEIALNLAAALRTHLRGGPCRVYKGDLKIRVANDFYYPDVFVRCGQDPGDAYFKTDPVLIAEVLSPSTQRYDRGDKRLAYSTLATLQDYVLISQDRMYVELYVAGSSTASQCLQQPDYTLHFASVDFSISLAELYE